MDIGKIKQYNLLKKEAEKYGQQSKNFDSENSVLNHCRNFERFD